jgi:ribosomal protein L25 (general stress protein Ctc)
MKFDLTVESRDGGGKGPARQLRRAGRVPAVLYGQGECLLLSVKPDELVKILRSQAGIHRAHFSHDQRREKQTESHGVAARFSGGSDRGQRAACGFL